MSSALPSNERDNRTWEDDDDQGGWRIEGELSAPDDVEDENELSLELRSLINEDDKGCVLHSYLNESSPDLSTVEGGGNEFSVFQRLAKYPTDDADVWEYG